MDPYFHLVPSLLHGLSLCIFLALIYVSRGKYQNGPSHPSLDKALHIRPPHGLLPSLWIICSWASCLSSLTRWYGVTYGCLGLYSKQKICVGKFLYEGLWAGSTRWNNSPPHVTYNVFVVHNGDWKVTINTYFISGEDVIQLIRRQWMPLDDQ